MRPVTKLIHGRPHDLKMAQDHGVFEHDDRSRSVDTEHRHCFCIKSVVSGPNLQHRACCQCGGGRYTTDGPPDEYDVWWGRAAEWCMRVAWRILWSWR